MPAITQIPEFYPTQYGTNWEFLSQQLESKLREYVTVDTVNGKEKTYNQIGEVAGRLITARSAPTTPQDLALAKRWLRLQGYDSVHYLDEFDSANLGPVVLPTSKIMQAQVTGYHLAIDSVIKTALGGTAYTGETGTTATTFPSGQSIPVNFVPPNTTGLTLAKLIRAKSLLARNEVRDSELIFVHRQQQIDDLLNNVTEVKSSDYAQVKALMDGSVDRFMGFKFVRYEGLDVDAGTGVATCFAYAKSGVVLGLGERKTKMSIRDDLNETIQIRTAYLIGATRLEEEKVVRVYCDEVI